MVIALTLGAVGVPAETIVADYALSEAQLAGDFASASRRQLRADGVDWERLPHPPHQPRRLHARVLAYLDAEHGGITGYLRADGVRDEQFAALRDGLTE